MGENSDRYGKASRKWRVKLFARASTPRSHSRLREILRQLERHDAADRIDGYDVQYWEGRVQQVDDQTQTPDCVVWFSRFETAAEQHGWDLRPCFEHAHHVSAMSGEEYEEFVFPVLAIAVVSEDEIVELGPRIENGRHISVERCLEKLARIANGARPQDESSAEMELSP